METAASLLDRMLTLVTLPHFHGEIVGRPYRASSHGQASAKLEIEGHFFIVQVDEAE